jgi:NAD(P)-dependent dehydrogenase (short-subunit alcohol dehydrogenase family)
MRTSLCAMFWFCKHALPHLQPGSSINTSSVQATSPSPELLDYATRRFGAAGSARRVGPEGRHL